jgi:signal transduction histidine kinase/ligand-binding sensor domain-containing protein/CheY-like chemotaxis protein
MMHTFSKYTLLTCFLYGMFFGIRTASPQNQNLVFRHLSTEDGLSQSTVHAIYQDRMGFMWFGTNIGLDKYDGVTFTGYQYNVTDSMTLASNFVVEIFEDSYGTFWIGNGYAGLNRFDREKELFYRYSYTPGKPGCISNNNIRAIFEDSRKNLWIGTAGGGLNLYDRESDSFIHFRHDSLSSSDIGTNFISSIIEDKNGYLWFGSQEGILVKYDPQRRIGKSFKLFSDYRADLYNTTFSQLYIDSENDIWFGTENGLYVYDQEKETFQHFVKGNTNKSLNANMVASVLEVEKGLYLITTDHGGMNIYDKKSGTFKYLVSSKLDESSLSNNQLYSIYRSADGIIWIGSFQGGINILDENANRFQQYKNLVDPSEFLNSRNSVLTICDDKDKNIWIGTDGQGIDIIDPKTFQVRRLSAGRNNPNSILGNSVTEIYRDRNNDLWIGTYLQGLSRLDWNTKQMTYYRNDLRNSKSIGGNNVWTILEDDEGMLWIGTMGNGLDRLDRKSNVFTHFTNNPNDPESLSNNDVFKVFQDKAGQIWAGTRNGLCLLDKKKGKFTRFMPDHDRESGIFGGWIYDIFQDRLGNLWIGTDQGLNRYHPEDSTFEHYQAKDGMSGSAVLTITCDAGNNLWMATNKGLCRFNYSLKEFRNFSVAGGQQSNEFNYTAVFCSSDGMMYFGGKTGFVVFHPDSIRDIQRIPPVYFTRIAVMNQPVGPRQKNSVLTKHINFEKTITLKYKQSVISLEFAALNYSNPEKNQYAYWLEGFDHGWNYIGNKHEVTYTNLNPGKYLLKVKGSNNYSTWNEAGTTLEIIVLPPWWKSWWFQALSYLTLAGLVLLLFLLRISFYRNQQKKLIVLVKERTFQLEEVAVTLEEKQEEINSQNEELMTQRDELENTNSILIGQKQRILEQNQELDKHRNQLELLVEERTHELIEAKEKAEESDRLKSSFLANLSHEIRTPLNAIVGFSLLLGEKRTDDEERDEYNAIIQNSSNTLLELISDILDISRIEAGQLELDLKEVSLEAVISDLVGIYDLFMKREDIGSNKPVHFRVAIEDVILKTQLITDKLRLEQILSNLISNAIKFTREGYIELGCTKVTGEEMLEFYVKDTGIGIKEEYQQIIFERFRKVEEDKSHLQRGTGLGLAITSQLVTLLGGTIRVFSRVGEGSVFYFTIPLIKADTPYIPIQKLKMSNIVPDFLGCRILVAEDDLSNFHYIEKLLKKAHASVIHAENGKEVLQILQVEHDIQLILMDIKMPEMDGIEALKELKKLNIQIPVIAQTAYALADEVVKLKKEGFADYISKPIQREHLYSVIEKFLHQVC